MRNGYGAPFASVHNGEDKHIRALVVSLKYVYKQEGGDNCIIKLRSSNTSLVDLDDIQHGKKLFLKWGYIRGQVSGTRTVYVIDSDEAFDEQGVVVTLKCYPRAEYMKMIARKIIAPGANIDDVIQVLAKQSGVDYKELADGSPGGLNRQPIEEQDDGSTTPAIDNTARVLPRYYDLVVQPGIKDYAQAEMMAANEPGGPYDVVARDDKLQVVKRDFSTSPVRYWRWKGGDGQLLKFKYSSNNKSKLGKATNVELSTWDPDTKSFKEGDVNITSDDVNTTSGEMAPTSTRGAKLTQAVKDKGSAIYNTLFSSSNGYLAGKELIKYQDSQDNPDGLDDEFYLEEGEKEAEDIGEGKPHPYKGYASTSIDSSGRIWYTPFDGSPTQGQLGEELPDDVGTLDNLDKVVPWSAITPLDLSTVDISAETDSSDESGGSGYAVAGSDNARAKAAMEIHSGNCTMVGYPTLVSGVMISLLGIGKKNSGNWFVLECTHTIDVGKAYLLQTKVLRNGQGISDTGGNITKVNGATNNAVSDTTDPGEEVIVEEKEDINNCRLLHPSEKDVYQATIISSQEVVGLYNYLKTGFEVKSTLPENQSDAGVVDYERILFGLLVDLEDKKFTVFLGTLSGKVTGDRVEKVISNFNAQYKKVATALDRNIICPKDENDKIVKPPYDRAMKALTTYGTLLSKLLKSKGI